MEGVKVGCGLQYIKRALKTNDWSSTECRLFKEIRHELTENNNIILKGSQIILPKPLRQCVINIAHQGHLGVTKTVGLLKTKVFWPNLYKDVTNFLRPCLACQAVTPSYKPEPLKPSPLPTAPWCVISADFHGPLPSGEKLLREKMKTDNGPPFDSKKLAEFLKAKESSIHHRKITPVHPLSNAKCERFMRVVGKTLKTARIERKNWRKEIDKLLFT